MAPRARPDSTTATLLREIAASQAGFVSDLKNLKERVDEQRGDTREARDAAMAMKAKLDEQNFPEQVTRLAGDFRQEVIGLRSDMVNANARLKGEINEVAGRVKILEDAHQRQDGAMGALGWLAKHAPWLAAIAVSAAATFGVDKVLK